MQYTEKQLKPVKDFLESQGHGIKQELAAYMGVSAQQLSFYFRYRNMMPARYFDMLSFISDYKPKQEHSKTTKRK